MRVKKGSYRYGIMEAGNGFNNMHANSIKQILEYAVINFMNKHVIVWNVDTEIHLHVEKDGLYWPNYERTSASKISKVFNQ